MAGCGSVLCIGVIRVCRNLCGGLWGLRAGEVPVEVLYVWYHITRFRDLTRRVRRVHSRLRCVHLSAAFSRPFILQQLASLCFAAPVAACLASKPVPARLRRNGNGVASVSHSSLENGFRLCLPPGETPIGKRLTFFCGLSPSATRQLVSSFAPYAAATGPRLVLTDAELSVLLQSGQCHSSICREPSFCTECGLARPCRHVARSVIVALLGCTPCASNR